MDLDIVSVGDSTLDVFLTLNEQDVDIHCRLDRPTCEICFNYADKIPVESVDFSLGGNAANNAVAMSRLGFKTALYTIHGEDETGRMIGEKMKDEGLATDFIFSQQGPSSYSTVINYKGERTILEKKYLRHYELFPNFPQTSWLYVSSLGPDFEGFFTSISKFIIDNRVKLGFNPAQLQLRKSFKTYENIVEAAYVIFMNKEEAAQLLTSAQLGIQDLRSPGMKTVGPSDWFTDSSKWGTGQLKKALFEIHRLGPKIVAITDGPRGAYAFDGSKYYFCNIFEVPIIERTGAGDAFAAGFQAALMRGQEVVEAMRWGTFNSAAVIGQIGPQKGLLTRVEMEKRLQEHDKPKAEEI